MRIIINGEQHDFETPISLSTLLKQLGLDQRKIAVERNRELVPRATFQHTDLFDGDTL